MMNGFKDIFKGQTIWIVGKGPSLQYLTRKHIGSGPIIAINQSIIKVEDLDLPNPVFSMQKDGGNRRTHLYKPFPNCPHTPNCGDVCGAMVKPKRRATLLVHKYESLWCFPDYSPRYVFDWIGLGLSHNTISLITAIKIGMLMGCEKFNFVSCGSFYGHLEEYVPGIGVIGTRPRYKEMVEETKPYLVGLNCEWIIPEKEEA